MAPIGSLDMVSYSHLIASMAISLAVCEISKNGMTLKTGLGLFKVIKNGAVQ